MTILPPLLPGPAEPSGLGTGTAGTQGAVGRGKDTPEKILAASRQFEALLIGQLLKGAKDSDSGDEDGDDSTDGALMEDIGQQQFSLALAQNGGLGIAKTIADSFSRRS